MQPYLNLSGDSGVLGYEITEDAIIVRFVKGGHYRYTRHTAGGKSIEAMKALARSGRGLATFIGTRRPGFDSKW